MEAGNTQKPRSGHSVRGDGPSKVPDQIASALRREIASGALRPGHRLPTEHGLCQRFGAGRPAVREAISKLKYDGLVETRQGSGAYVAEAGPGLSFRIEAIDVEDREELRQIFELRITVEAAAAAMAAGRRTTRQLAKIRKSLNAMERAIRSGEDAVPSDAMFHIAIAEATGNGYFKTFMEFLEARLRRSIEAARVELQRDRIRARDVHAEHVAIYRAIEAMDPERARAAALLHLNHAAEELDLLPLGHRSRNRRRNTTRKKNLSDN